MKHIAFENFSESNSDFDYHLFYACRVPLRFYTAKTHRGRRLCIAAV
jgi:hypothetical protein